MTRCETWYVISEGRAKCSTFLYFFVVYAARLLRPEVNLNNVIDDCQLTRVFVTPTSPSSMPSVRPVTVFRSPFAIASTPVNPELEERTLKALVFDIRGLGRASPAHIEEVNLFSTWIGMRVRLEMKTSLTAASTALGVLR